jgi:hypothetical protein
MLRFCDKEIEAVYYGEPPYFLKWLENICGEVLLFKMVRNQCVRVSGKVKVVIRMFQQKGVEHKVNYTDCIRYILPYASSDYENPPADNEILFRFEDLKLEPEAKLTELCEKLEIPWSDVLMITRKFQIIPGERFRNFF